MRKKILRISLVVGILLFCLVVYKVGPGQILNYIKRLSWKSFLVLFGLRIIYWILRTFNWKTVARFFDTRQSYFLLFEARIVANAISYLTPSAMLGGEPIRALMMDGTSRRKNIATVVLDKTIEIITMSFFTILAVVIAIICIPMPVQYRILFIVFVVLTIFLCLFLWLKQKQGFFIWIFNVLGKIKIRSRFIERNKEKIRDVDGYISDFYRNHKTKIPLIAFLYSLTFLFWVAEIHVTLLFLKAPGLTLFKSFLVITMGNVALLLPTIPASLGVYEITNVGIFALLGWRADIALSMAIIRRILMLLWTGIGLLAMARNELSLKNGGKLQV